MYQGELHLSSACGVCMPRVSRRGEIEMGAIIMMGLVGVLVYGFISGGSSIWTKIKGPENDARWINSKDVELGTWNTHPGHSGLDRAQGRYQMVVTRERAYVLDSMTGRMWIESKGFENVFSSAAYVETLTPEKSEQAFAVSRTVAPFDWTRWGRVDPK